MKTMLLCTFAALSLVACATGPAAYGPATTQSALGFTNQQIEHDRFFVTFTGRSVDEARSLALLRAAEITLAQGYKTFRVVGAGTQGNDRGRTPVSSSIGIGVGSGGYHRGTRTSVGLGVGVGDIAQALGSNKVTASMEILLSHTPRGAQTDVYDAKSIVDSIRPHTFTN